MSDITKHEPSAVSADTLAHVLGTGDISKLTTAQRVEYMVATCRSLGLNPLTRPFQFLTLNNKMMLYATKDCTDQLRTVHGITLHIVDKALEDDLYVVTARARNATGREDEDVGAVLLPRAGESRANAIMKATTKAKRRVTLSICGLGGMPDESELDGMPGATTFDAEDEPPVAPIRAAAAPTPRPARKVAPPVHVFDSSLDLSPLDEPNGPTWLINLELLTANAQTDQEMLQIGDHDSVRNVSADPKAPDHVKQHVSKLLSDGYKRVVKPIPRETPDDLEIAGEQYMASGD